MSGQDRAARHARKVGLTLDGLQDDTDQKPLHKRRKWLVVINQVKGSLEVNNLYLTGSLIINTQPHFRQAHSSAELTTKSEELLVPFIPQVRPYVDYFGATLTYNEDSSFNLEIGHVVRVASGMEYIIVSFRSHFTSRENISTFEMVTPVGYYLHQGR
jgi:hypothetical protein